jgi:uncharacterized membrane-anchored protein YitT (DUF2179 family)
MENKNKQVLSKESKKDIKNLFVMIFSVIIALLFLLLTGATAGGFLVAACWMAFYLLPSFIASARKHRSWMVIFALNILFGWTFIGWAFALIWSLTGNIESKEGDS